MGLLIACVGAILACIPHGVPYGWTDPKVAAIIIGLAIAINSKERRKPSLLACYAVAWYFAFAIPSFFVTKNLAFSMVGFPGFYSWSAASMALCSCGFICATREPWESRDRIIRACMCAGAIVAAYAFLQQFGADPLNVGEMPQGRSVATIGSPIDMAAMLIVLLTYSRNPLFLIGIWAAHSRGAWLAVPVAALPFGRLETGMRAALFSAALAAGVIGTMRGTEYRDIMRRDCWNSAVQEITSFGSGPATFAYTFTKYRKTDRNTQIHAHNSILDTLSTRGVLGLFGLLALLVAPELAGLWLICMFNPVSFEVVFIACVLAGLHLRRKEDEGRVTIP
jgi:hypothetical protein